MLVSFLISCNVRPAAHVAKFVLMTSDHGRNVWPERKCYGSGWRLKPKKMKIISIFFLVVETSNFHRGIRLLNKGPHQWAVQHETQVITTFTCVLLCSFTFYLIDVRVRVSDHRLLTTSRNTSGFKFKFFSVWIWILKKSWTNFRFMAAHLHIKYLRIRTRIEFQPKNGKLTSQVVENFTQKSRLLLSTISTAIRHWPRQVRRWKKWEKLPAQTSTPGRFFFGTEIKIIRLHFLRWTRQRQLLC